MDRLFMLRTSAVLYLLKRRREWSTQIESVPTGNIEFEAQQLDLIERLILDVRAGRVNAFTLNQPNTIEVFVSD